MFMISDVVVFDTDSGDVVVLAAIVVSTIGAGSVTDGGCVVLVIDPGVGFVVSDTVVFVETTGGVVGTLGLVVSAAASVDDVVTPGEVIVFSRSSIVIVEMPVSVGVSLLLVMPVEAISWATVKVALEDCGEDTAIVVVANCA